MPNFTQLQPLFYRHVAETFFLAGTTVSEQDDTDFALASGTYEIRFEGVGLTYGESGVPGGGTITGMTLSQNGAVTLVGSSATSLISGADLGSALSLAEAGDLRGAVALLQDAWEGEFFSYTNQSGGLLRGTLGGDGLTGGALTDIIYAEGGDDTVLLNGGNDEGHGGRGADLIIGGAGDDHIHGDDGDDRLAGDDGQDDLYGGTGDDVARGGRGNDLAYGGNGDDNLIGNGGADALFANGGADMLDGGRGADALYGGTGGDELKGGKGSDELIGGAGGDTLNGGAGGDRLVGGAGYDEMNGGRGRDILVGGIGADQMAGGAGADVFVILDRAAGSETVQTTRISDFVPLSDAVDLTIFGLDVDQIDAATTQRANGDVLVDLGDNQQLLIEGVEKSLFLDSLLIVLPVE